MTKELERALKRIKKSHYAKMTLAGISKDKETEDAIAVVEKELERLEEQDKILAILEEKWVDVWGVVHYSTVQAYEADYENDHGKILTEEEYKLLRKKFFKPSLK